MVRVSGSKRVLSPVLPDEDESTVPESAFLLDRAYSDPDKPGDADDALEAGPDAQATPRTAFEKKIQLVTREIDVLGFGRYQWGLFFVCGSGWLLDLLWAHAFGLAMPAIQRELGFSEFRYGYLSTGFSLGMSLGALTWGILLDTVGRRAAFNYTVAISSLFGICIGFANNYAILVFLVTGVGFGVGGNIPVDTTIFLEFIPSEKRTMLIVMSIFQPIGSILSTLVAWTLVPMYSCEPNLPSCKNVADPANESCCSRAMNQGWRYMFYTISFITVFIFGIRFLAFTMLESPAFLLASGRDTEAVFVVQQIARMNGKTSQLTIEKMESQINDLDTTLLVVPKNSSSSKIMSFALRKLSALDMSHLKLLFKNPVTIRLTVLTWLIYAADFWGFTLAGVFLPKILLQKGTSQDMTVTDTYREYIFIALAGIPGALLSMYLVDRGIGQRITMIVSSISMAASLFLFATISSKRGNLIFNCIEYFSQTIFNAVLYAWTPGAFEPGVRGSATGIAAFWGRTISIIAPIIGSAIYAGEGGGLRVLFAAGSGTLVATLGVALLP